MRTLAPVDFKAVAAKGCFVYCYLRKADFSPYYVGISSNHSRPVSKLHNCAVPADRSLIRVMKAGLSWDQAKEWEIRYIAVYGRKDIGTGILRNRTDGGEGFKGLVFTEQHRQAIRRTRAKVVSCPKWRHRQRMAHLGKPCPDHVREMHAQRMSGHKWSEAEIAARALTRRQNEASKRAAAGITEEVRRARKREQSREWARRQALSKNGVVGPSNQARQAAAAARLGVPVQIWMSLDAKKRHCVRQRHSYGWPVSRLLEGLTL
jgi:hypothetical protein